MSDTDTDTTMTEDQAAEAPDDRPDDDTEVVDETDTEDAAETFPREYVEKLRGQNAKYRDRAKVADAYATRLHNELVKSTGRLADPTDLPFDAEHLDDAEALAAAIDDLLARKPHLASRKPSGDIGQGHRGGSSESFNLLGMLKERT
ncbi:MAG: hypothetical protein ACRDUX_26320 [Mycobacterium sp.]